MMRNRHAFITAVFAALLLAMLFVPDANAMRFIGTPTGFMTSPVLDGGYGGYGGYYWDPYNTDPNNYINPGYYNSNLRNLDVTIPYNQLRMQYASHGYAYPFYPYY